MNIKMLNENEKFKGKTFTLFERDFELRHETKVTWEIIKKKNSVAVVPIDSDGNIYMLNQFFAAVNDWGLTLPKGSIEDGESSIEAAAKELNEETGLEGDLTELITVSVSPGYLTQLTTIFIAKNLKPAKKRLKCDENEIIEVIKMPFKEALSKIIKGNIVEARTVAGLLLANEELNNNGISK